MRPTASIDRLEDLFTPKEKGSLSDSNHKTKALRQSSISRGSNVLLQPGPDGDPPRSAPRDESIIAGPDHGERGGASLELLRPLPHAHAIL
mmetsp:Transcript_28680/g.84532  ORF Transcript_28680/g.84532 Transcript_28680/m.84532 type:complete len:91 (+) Transcript_28680:154-426(+)